MKKILSHVQFFCLFTLFTLSNSHAHSQSLLSCQNATTPSPFIAATSSNQGTYQFQVGNLPSCATGLFWIFGDGHFSTSMMPTHRLQYQNNSVKAFLLEPYKPSQPPGYACSAALCLNGGISSSTVPNPKIQMAPMQFVKIGTSWNPTPGGKHYTIITFENLGGMTKGKVKLTFNNNVNSAVINPFDNNQNWTSIPSVNGSMIKFNFDNLSFGEQRHVLVETVVAQNPSGKAINYTAEMFDAQDVLMFQQNSSSRIKRYPHDPNDKIVSEEEICASHAAKELKYTITFQNEGSYYATNVLLHDLLPEELDFKTFQLISSSHPCTVSPSNNDLYVFFDLIMLPGLAQTFPFIPHPNETIGFIEFSIFTHPCLTEGEVDNECNIFFDSLDPIITPVATTVILDNEPCSQNSINCGDGGYFLTLPESNSNDASFGLNVYPNPVQGMLNLEITLNETSDSYGKLAIYDTMGRVIRDLSNQLPFEKGTHKLEVNTKDWSAGFYFIKMSNGNETSSWKLNKL